MGAALSHSALIAFGIAHPAYASIVSLTEDRKKESSLWLAYWVVFCIFKLIDRFLRPITSWFPMYWSIRTAFILWLAFPKAQGAQYIYNGFLIPLFRNHKDQIDAALIELRNVLNVRTDQLIMIAYSYALVTWKKWSAAMQEKASSSKV